MSRIALPAGDWLVAHGLDLALLPRSLGRALREVREDLYASRADTPEPSDLRPFLERAAGEPCRDLAVLGESGGALHLYVIEGRCGVFVQTRLTDYGLHEEDGGREFAADARAAAALMRQARRGGLGPTERLLAYSSSFTGRAWLRLDARLDAAGLDQAAWRAAEDPFAAAAASLGPEPRRFAR